MSYGITKEQYIEVCKNLKLGATPDSFSVTLSILKNKYKLPAEKIRFLIENRFDLISDKDFVTGLTRLQIRFKISDEKLSNVLGSWRVRDFGVDVEYLSSLQKQVGLTDTEMVSAICFSKIPRYKPEPETVQRNLEILDRAGLKRENLWRGISVLTCKPRRLVDVLMLGMVQGFEVNDFIFQKCHNLHSDLVYARMCAERDGVIPKGLVYLNDKEFERNTNGMTNEQLMAKYKFGFYAKLDLEKKFLEMYPEKYGLIEEGARCFADYLDQRLHQFYSESPENEIENRRLLLEDKLSNTFIEWLFDNNLKLKTMDPKLLSYNIYVLHFMFGRDENRVVLSNPQLVANQDNRLYNCFSVLHNRYGVSKAEFAIIIRNNPNIANDFVNTEVANDRLFEAESFYSSIAEMNKKSYKNFLMSAYPAFMDFESAQVESKLFILQAFGVGVEDVLNHPGVLIGNANVLELKLKLATMNGLSIDEFINGCYMYSQNKIYARMMGVSDSLVPAYAVYASTKRFEELVDSGKALSQEQLSSKYILNGAKIFEINQKFAQDFPEIQAKLSNSNLVRQQNICDTKSEKNADDDLENFKRRLKRICGLSDEQLSILLERIGELNLNLLTNIIVNLYKLKNMGFSVDVIVKMPKLLKSKPEDNQLKAMMSRLMGKSDEQFIKRNHTYGVESVYAKFTETKEQGIAPLNIYDSNGDFEKYLLREANQACTVNFLKSIHRLDDNAKSKIYRLYCEKFGGLGIFESECGNE